MSKLKWWQPYLLASVLALTGASVVGAQEAEPQAPAEAQDTQPPEQVLELGELRVVGSRVAGRSAQESAVPVDIIQGEDLQTYGIRDMDSLLAASVPSYNVSREPISDAATLMRPASLRGLPPDSTLVLVNGKRRHRGSVINLLGSPVSRGSQGVDLSSIPSIALQQVEVLRDGAAAQYGSDAIAGVLNFKLREDTEGLSVQTSYGQNYHGDGDKVNVAANLGMPLTENGFANFSFEFLNEDETSRSVQRNDARGLVEAGNTDVRRPAALIWGNPEVQYDYKFFGNLGLDLEEMNARLYAYGNYAERKVEGGFYYRNPNTRSGVFAGAEPGTLRVADLSADGVSGNCPTIPINPAANYQGALAGFPDCFAFNERFPGGFTPRFGGYVQDWSIAFGLRGELSDTGLMLLDGWSYDASAYFGQSSVDYFINNTINPQLADMRTGIPTEYRPGANRQFEKTFNLDISKPFDVGIFYSPLNVAFGFEYHTEEFEIEAGEENSWYVDTSPGRVGQNGKTLAEQGFGVGSNGFTGFRPDFAGTFERNNYALYMDLEAEVIRSLTLGVAGRYENFDGTIGETLNGKVSARWQIVEMLALRGAISSGFRAPTPGQINLSNVTTAFGPGGLQDELTLPAAHPAAAFFGAKPLTPEKSVNYSAGIAFNLGAVEMTLDYYRIKMQDRIARSNEKNITDANRDAFLSFVGPAGSDISSVRFYTNDFDTTTQGIDLVASYSLVTSVGNTQFTFVGNWNKTEIDSRNPDNISEKQARQLEMGLPQFRFSQTIDHSYGPWRFLTRLHFYDSFLDYPTDSSYSFRGDERFLVDMEASYTFLNLPYIAAATIAAGAENVFDQYPRRNPFARRTGLKYPETTPYTVNGGFYYLRAGFEF